MNYTPNIDTDGFDWHIIGAAWVVAAVVVTATFSTWGVIS